MHDRADEYIDSRGHLRVPVARSLDPNPKRDGWTPFWVNVNLGHEVQKVVSYKRAES